MSDAGTRAAEPATVIWLDRALLLAAGLLAVFLCANLLAFGYGRDQGIYAVVADAIARGGAPYRDAWDFKPPGIYLVFAWARVTLGPEAWAIRVVELLFLAATGIGIATLSRRSLGDVRAAAIGGLVALLGYVQLEFWSTAQPEGFAVALLVWAIVLSDPRARASATRAFARRTAAGALYGAAALLKPPLGGGILVSWLLTWRAVAGRERVAATLAFALGGLLPPLVAVGWLAGRGALGDAVDVLFGFVPHYLELTYASESFPAAAVRTLRVWLFDFVPYTAVGLALLVLLPPLHAREREAVLHVAGVAAISLLGVALQAKFFQYHFAPALVLGGLLAGWGFWKLWLRARRRALAAAGWLALVGILHGAWIPGLPDTGWFWKRCGQRVAAWRNPQGADATWARLERAADTNPAANRRVAAWLREHTEPDGSIYVWGFEPGIYDLANRRPASRFIYNVPQRVEWGREEARRLLMAELERSKPAAIVRVRNDRIPQVTGNRRDSREELEGFPELRAWIDARYERVFGVEDLEVLMPPAPVE